MKGIQTILGVICFGMCPCMERVSANGDSDVCFSAECAVVFT